MIIQFDKEVFTSSNSTIQSTIAGILVELQTRDFHFIDFSQLPNVFFDERNRYIFDLNQISQTHFSKLESTIFQQYIEKKITAPITNMHRKHLRKLKIGLNKEAKEVHPEDALRIIKERSKIILENGINDWKFIKGVCQKYTSSSSRKNIYKIINNAIRNEFIESDSGGGVGEIVKQTKKWIESIRYNRIHHYKLMVLFDSDKKKKDEHTPHIKVIEYLKNKTIIIPERSDYDCEEADIIYWHILEKRKIENYVPLSVVFNNIHNLLPAQKERLKGLSQIDLDYFEYALDNIGLSDKVIKESFPNMFLSNFSFSDLESRCSHHKIYSNECDEEITELEHILLKIAKIL